MGIKCFLLEPTDTVQLWLRRYSSRSKCPGHYCHDAQVRIDDAPAIWSDRHGRTSLGARPEKFSKSYPLWPLKCGHCGYEFSRRHDVFQVSQHLIYRRADDGSLVTLRDAPIGAMWYADWFLVDGSNIWRGPDGHSLCVRLPGNHDWLVDGRASNCTMPNDKEHKCWVRHGKPPVVTVDKKGLTCAAGAGSIGVPGWHGFLRNGELVT